MHSLAPSITATELAATCLSSPVTEPPAGGRIVLGPRVDGRFHGLDAARATALLLGVVLHACPVYEPADLPQALRSGSPDALPFVIGYHYIHTFRLPVFFVLAGFFGRMLLAKRGVRGFLRNRARSIAIPFAFGCVTLAPLTNYLSMWRLQKLGLPSESPPTILWRFYPIGTQSGTFENGVCMFHLWFLYYLMLIYAVVLLIRWATRKLAPFGSELWSCIERLSQKLLVRPWGLLVISAGTAAVLTRMASVYGIRTPNGSLIPDKSVLTLYLLCFGIGWFLFGSPVSMNVLRSRAPLYLGLGVFAGWVALAIIAHAMTRPGWRFTSGEGLGFSGVYGGALVLLTLGFIGAFIRWGSRPSAVIRYLSDASYWIYLAHLPLLYFLQGVLAPLRWHWSLRIPLDLAVTFGLLLLSYQFLVRYTWIGRILNGPRRKGELRGYGRPAAHEVVPAH